MYTINYILESIFYPLAFGLMLALAMHIVSLAFDRE